MAAPSSIQLVGSPAQTGFTVTWVAVPGASGYNLYKDGTKVDSDIGATQRELTGLSANTAYTIEVSAIGTGKTESVRNKLVVTTAAVPPQPPATPSNLTSSNLTSTGVSLAWVAVAGATSYKVYKGGMLLQSSLTQPKLEVTGLTPSTAYLFEVTAINAEGESAKAVIDVTTPAGSPSQTTLDAPAGLGTSAATSKSVTLTWQPVTGATGYKVYKDGANLTSTSSVSYAFTNLTAGTPYTLGVSAIAEGGVESATSTLTYTPAAEAGPTATASTLVSVSGATAAAYRDGALYYITASGDIMKVSTAGGTPTKAIARSAIDFPPDAGTLKGLGAFPNGDFLVLTDQYTRAIHADGSYIREVGWVDPQGVIAEPSGSFVVAHNPTNSWGSIARFDPANPAAGTQGLGDATGGTARFRRIAMDGSGTVFVADSGSNLLRKNGGVSLGSVMNPVALAVVGSYLYFNEGSKLKRVSTSAANVSSAVEVFSGLDNVKDLVGDGSGNVYAVEAGAIRKFVITP